MKKNDPKIYARALYEAMRGLRGQELTAAIERFVRLLARAGLIKKAERVAAEFERYAKQAAGIMQIEVTSARGLDAATLNQIKSVLGRADKVEAVEKVNPDLLGGVVVRTRDRILDGSLRTQLSNLKLKLSN